MSNSDFKDPLELLEKGTTYRSADGDCFLVLETGFIRGDNTGACIGMWLSINEYGNKFEFTDQYVYHDENEVC